DLPALPAVLVNPGVLVPTKDVFARLALEPGARRGEAVELDSSRLKERDALIGYIRAHPNDLEAAAVSMQPPIADVLAALARRDGCLLARMSGSGATCFGLFDAERTAMAAARSLTSTHPAWWVSATVLGDGCAA